MSGMRLVPHGGSVIGVCAILCCAQRSASGGAGSACCLDANTCVLASLDGCISQGGEYLGLAPTEVDCPSNGQCLGACCLNLNCSRIGRADCLAQSGVYKGSGTVCNLATCGAPCTSDADCSDGNVCNGAERCLSEYCYPGLAPYCNDQNDYCTLDRCDMASGCYYPPTGYPECGACCNRVIPCEPATESFCTMTRYGTFHGAGTTCDSGLCLGPCCLGDEECIEVEQYQCNDRGWFGGVGGTCGEFDCSPTGACCTLWGPCLPLDDAACNQGEGSFRGLDSTCDDPGICDAPCCLGGTECVVLSYEECSDIPGLFRGPWGGQECTPCNCYEFAPGYTHAACCTANDECIVTYPGWCFQNSGIYVGGQCGPNLCSCQVDEDCEDGDARNDPMFCKQGRCYGSDRSLFRSLVTCLNGPAAEIAPGCACTNLRNDEHIDLKDAAVHLNYFPP